MAKNLDHGFPTEDDITDDSDRGDVIDDESETIEEEEVEEQKPAKKAPAKKEEEESEEEEEEESEEEEEEESEEEDRETGKTVAIHVLKKAQAKRRAAEQRVKDLENQLRQKQDDTTDRQKAELKRVEGRVDELYEQIEEARAEGRTKDAAKLQRELDGINSEMTRKQAAYMATKQALESQNLMAYNALVSELETIDPRFDESSDSFDEDLVDRVSELTEGYEARGISLPDALRKSLRLIMGNDPFREGRKLQREDDKKEPPKKQPAKKVDVKKALDAKKKQPPEDRSSEVERSGDQVDAMKLTEEEFDKLPEETKRRLRGDFGDE